MARAEPAGLLIPIHRQGKHEGCTTRLVDRLTGRFIVAGMVSRTRLGFLVIVVMSSGTACEEGAGGCVVRAGDYCLDAAKNV